MKKQGVKITLKTDKVVSMSKSQAQHVVGGGKNTNASYTREC
ncbi:class I lanthipeptide [Spirosoma areae]